MHNPIGKSHREYVDERVSRDPEFAAALKEADMDLNFALALVRQRERCGWTQRRLAEKSGIMQPMIARIERGSQSPRYNTIHKLLRALDARMVAQPNGQVSIVPASPDLSEEWQEEQESLEPRPTWAAHIELDREVVGDSSTDTLDHVHPR